MKFRFYYADSFAVSWCFWLGGMCALCWAFWCILKSDSQDHQAGRVDCLSCRWPDWCGGRSWVIRDHTSPCWGGPRRSFIFVPSVLFSLFIKTSSPTSPRSSSYTPREPVLFICQECRCAGIYFGASGSLADVICAHNFHTSRNDVRRPFQKVAREWCSDRHVQTQTADPRVCHLAPRIAIRKSPAW